MTIEHVALNVPDPVGFADWYAAHLGMRVVRQVDGPPFTRFLADSAGRTVLEVYRQSVPVPDYATADPLVLHIAFTTDDVAGTRDRLVKAGGAAAGDIAHTPAGDVMGFVRDPWGVVIQLVTRAKPLLPG